MTQRRFSPPKNGHPRVRIDRAARVAPAPWRRGSLATCTTSKEVAYLGRCWRICDVLANSTSRSPKRSCGLSRGGRGTRRWRSVAARGSPSRGHSPPRGGCGPNRSGIGNRAISSVTESHGTSGRILERQVGTLGSSQAAIGNLRSCAPTERPMRRSQGEAAPRFARSLRVSGHRRARSNVAKARCRGFSTAGRNL